MGASKNDRNLLRNLANQVAEIASLPVHEETRKLWKAINSLKPLRPMVAINQIPWHEMNVNDELTLLTVEDFFRTIEWKLRETLYRWRHMPADMIVEPFIDIPKVIGNTGFGITLKEDTSVSDPLNDVVGHKYMNQLQTEEDILKIKTPEITLDVKATSLREEIVREVFDGILGVRMTGTGTGFAPWDMIVQWHGVENSLYDLADRPEFIHKLMARLTQAHLSMLDQLEEQGLLAYDMPTIHCSGAYTDELPTKSINPALPKAKDTWTCGMAQIFATVSPAMHEEFELDYANKWYERFGLVYYGCCEPLHNKIYIVRKIPNLRKISISPWADVQNAAEQIGGDFVISSKPSPAYLVDENWNCEAIRENLADTYEICRRTGTPLEFILKDISTVRYQPQRLWEWSEMAMNLVKA